MLFQIIGWALVAVLLFLYLKRRRSRLERESSEK